MARAAINLYNKTVRFVNNYPRKITYTPPPEGIVNKENNRHAMEKRRLVLFTDAGFGSLANSHSIEGTVTILASVTGRMALSIVAGICSITAVQKYSACANRHWQQNLTQPLPRPIRHSGFRYCSLNWSLGNMTSPQFLRLLLFRFQTHSGRHQLIRKSRRKWARNLSTNKPCSRNARTVRCR